MKRLIALLALGATVGLAPTVHAQISRSEVIDRAEAYVFYPWRSSAANTTASCVADYQTAYGTPGDYMGVAYDWGGWDSLFQFDQKLADGYGAGSPAFGDVYWCTTGVDCSGFISRAWQTSQKYATISIPDISAAISAASLLPGDVFNKASFHVTMFVYMLDNGEPYMYEAVGYNTHVNATGGWSYVNGYSPRRYDDITGTTIGSVAGGLSHPIEVDAFPYTHSGNTATSLSDVLDGCGAQPGSSQSGPETVYRIDITEPGTLTVAVTDDASADIDVHLYESWNTSDCVARHDSSFSRQLDCGTYYVVADTFSSDANAGNYELTMTFTPSAGQSCGPGPDGHDPAGGLGDGCGHPGEPDLPFCNPTLGGDVCLYTSGTDAISFCTAACETSSDCAGLGDGSCCVDIGDGETYCVLASLCGPDDGDDPNDGPGQDPGGDGGSGGDGDNGDGSTPGPDPSSDDGGGGCRAAGGNGGVSLGLGLLLLAVIGRRRRR